MFNRFLATKSFFSAKPVFTSVEFEEAFPGKGERANQALLNYHVGAGNLLRVRRGLYAVVPATSNADRFIANPLLVAGKIRDDSIISHHSALRFYGVAQSIRRIVTFTTKHKDTKSFEFQDSIFQPVLTPKLLLEAGKTDILVSTENYHGGQLKVTSIERTVVDCIDRFDIAGGLEEVLRSCDNLLALDELELVSYLKLLGSRTTIAKVGFFVEAIGLVRNPDIMELLRDHLPKAPTYLFRDDRQGKLVKRWNLIVPVSIIEKRWEKHH